MRDHLDRYYTPDWPTRGLLETLEDMKVSLVGRFNRVLEPCAGANGITHVLRAAGLNVVTGDLDQESVDAFGHDYCWDFAGPFPQETPRVDAVISNPPFLKATAIVRNALLASPRVAMLLRCTFGEPCVEKDEPWVGRYELFRLQPPSLMLWMPRATFGRPRGSFRGSTDSATACWFVWGLPTRDDGTITRWIYPREIATLSGQQELL